MPNDPATDQASLLALQEGNASALNGLIARWQRPLHSFAYRYCQNRADAEDLVAQTFTRLYQRRLHFRPDTKVSAWLFTTLTNFCHNHHRWKRRHPSSSLEPQPGDAATSKSAGVADATLDALISEHRSPAQALEHDETVAAVRSAIARLPHDLKVTLLLHHYDHLSYREIGEIVQCSERGVESRLYRARIQLKEMLRRELSQALTH